MQTAFLIRTNGKLKFIPFDEVLYIAAKNNYCQIVTTSKKKLLGSVTLGYMHRKLPEHLFCRIHRSYIISLKKIDWLDNSSVTIANEKLPLTKEGFKEITQKVLVISPELDNKLKIEMEGINAEKYAKKAKRKKGVMI